MITTRRLASFLSSLPPSYLPFRFPLSHNVVSTAAKLTQQSHAPSSPAGGVQHRTDRRVAKGGVGASVVPPYLPSGPSEFPLPLILARLVARYLCLSALPYPLHSLPTACHRLLSALLVPPRPSLPAWLSPGFLRGRCHGVESVLITYLGGWR